MSRLRRIERIGRYFFITTNLIRGTSPFSPAERDLCLALLDKTRVQFRFKLFAYVIMLDHVHLLISCFESDLPSVMRHWKTSVAVAIGRLRGKRGAVWQARYFDFILRRASDFSKKFMYIHENPIVAGLTAKPEDWRWSSAAFYIHRQKVLIQPDLFDVPVNPNEPLWPGWDM
jgi:REP element-mobilizing transposase RayT